MNLVAFGECAVKSFEEREVRQVRRKKNRALWQAPGSELPQASPKRRLQAKLELQEQPQLEP